MRESDFKRLTRWVDYDRPRLASLTKSQEIRYFQARVQRTVIAPLKRMCVDDRRGWKRESPLLCFGTCICCAIEALGKFYTGRLVGHVSRSNFEAFVQTYMNPGWLSNRFGADRYVDHLWVSFRNGLAHGLAIKQGGFEYQRVAFQVKLVGGVQQLEVDPARLFHDFRRGFATFVRDLRGAGQLDPLYVKFHDAFVGVYVRGL